MVDVDLDELSRRHRWLAPVATTLGAWLVAFLVVTALLTVFADELASLPLALRALLISGVLVALMLNLVMPLLSGASARWLVGPPPTTAGATAQDQVRRREPFLSPRSYPELDAPWERPTRTNRSVRTPRPVRQDTTRREAMKVTTTQCGSTTTQCGSRETVPHPD